jgi:hypothetical protein
VKLQNDVMQCVVNFELAFPPLFFNIVTHLQVHLVKEITILGPVYVHNMWPFERFMSYGPPWAHYLGGYQDRLLGGPLGLPDLRCTAPDGVKHKDYGRELLG